jgi:hypothetical protein
MNHEHSDLLGQVSTAQENNKNLSMNHDNSDLLGQVSTASGQFVARCAIPAPDGPGAHSGKRATETGIGPELASTQSRKHAPGTCGVPHLGGQPRYFGRVPGRLNKGVNPL